jgi:hypothetical protein
MTKMEAGWQVAVVNWEEGDGISSVLHDELRALGYGTFFVSPNEVIPQQTDVLLTFGPYGRLLPLLSQLVKIPVGERPLSIHWNTEGIPDPRIPWLILKPLALMRSQLDFHLNHSSSSLYPLRHQKPFSLLENRIRRFRYLGDMAIAMKRNWIQIYADTSFVYTQWRNKHGLPTTFMPWGSAPHWYADLQLTRDIDVLWMGKRASKRRSDLLDHVRHQLAQQGVQMYLADNEEHPFIFDEERTEILNRSKITLNLTRTWYDDNFSRFALAIPNRSLIVSEPVLGHCPYFEAGVHYVSTPPETLASQIMYYLEHEVERLKIVEQGYELLTTQLTLRTGLHNLMMQAQHINHPA